MPRSTPEQRELERLRLRLSEAEQTLEAIRKGEVDSLVIEGPEGLRVYALEGASNTYRVLIEAMSEGAATLTEAGVILYCNSRFARLFDLPLERVMGTSFYDRVPPPLRSTVDALLRATGKYESQGDVRLLDAHGQEVPTYLSVNAVHAEGRKLYCLVAVDLRPQRSTEEVLASERLASSVIEQAAEATIVVDGAGRVIRASTSAAQLCGGNPLLSPFGEAFPVVLTGELSGPRLVEAVLRGQTFRAAPATLRRADGPERQLLVSAARLQSHTADVIGCVITLVDVTESRRSELALRESEERIRAITDNASLGLVMMDDRQVCTFMNPAAEKILGYTLAEVQRLARPLHQIVHHTRPDGSAFPIEACALERALPTRRRQHGEDFFVRPDGTFYPVAYTASPMFDGEVALGTVIEVEDLTQRREREQELRLSQQRLELLARATAVFTEERLEVQGLLDRLVGELVPHHSQAGAVVLFGKDGEAVEVAAWRHALPAAQALLDEGMRISELKWTDLPGRDLLARGEPLLLVNATEAFKAVTSPQMRDYVTRFPIGSYVAVPLRTSLGTFGMLGVARPPAAAPFSEADLALMQDIVHRAALALEAGIRYAEAQQAVRLRDDFLSIASHELRTPLTALQLQLQSMSHLLKKHEANEERFLGKLVTANRQTARIGSLVDNLMDVSRLSLGRLELHREAVDLADVAQEVVERHASQALAAGCTVHLEAQSVRGEWDRSRLEQVLTNLVTNAVKYGAGQPITVTVASRGTFAELAVQDHGIGISPEDLDRIFGRFERAASASHYGGLGLGLYISRQIVDAHGGRVDVESEPGRGSLFKVSVPFTLRPRIEQTPQEQRV